MELDGCDLLDDGDEGGGWKMVSCSICLDGVIMNGDRSWAKLQCGHKFHLDCIGSAFNAKGAMQCPNCRKVERGQWLFANGCRSIPEVHFDDWAHDEDSFDMGYSDMPFAVQWRPFSGLAHLPSFEEGEFSSLAYHDLGQLNILSEHRSISSAGHPCPYMAYVRPIHPSPSTTNGSISEGFNFSSNWNGPVMNEMSSSYIFPIMDVHYHSWEHHSSTLPISSRISGSDQTPHSLERVDGPNYEIARPGSFMHPLIVGHRAGSSVVSPMFPPHPSRVVARAHDHVQALQANFQQPSASLAVHVPILTGTRRSNSTRGLSQVGSVWSSSDQNGGFYLFPPGASGRVSQDIENFMQNGYHTWEQNFMQNGYHTWEHEYLSASFSMSQVDRSSGYGSFHQATASSPNTLTRSRSSRRRNGTERIPPPNWP